MDKIPKNFDVMDVVFSETRGEIQDNHRFLIENDAFLSPETADETTVNVNKPWRKSIRRYIDFGRGDNEDLHK